MGSTASATRRNPCQEGPRLPSPNHHLNTLQISEDHKVVEKGPYRLVRHPSYTGILITLAGLGLAVQSLGALLVLLLFFVISFGYRMHVEERALLSGLGQDYASYMKRTKRLIPFLI
ncbi:isoprenylcysteine carboxylmethyltransferase family protein [Candidatus Bathyarchaeota archaeon]|nr:MAG: isoprenylcysteine carboxylmethyltransferase family protein [Candidatus Bathyarchaeota archaeon]